MAACWGELHSSSRLSRPSEGTSGSMAHDRGSCSSGKPKIRACEVAAPASGAGGSQAECGGSCAV